MTRKDVPQLGSPVYHITIGDIVDGSFEVHDMDEGVYRKYAPFDFIEILNKSALTLELVLNDVHYFPILASASISKADLSFRRFKIVNESGANLTGTDLYVSIQHSPLDADKVARQPKGLMEYIPLAGFLFWR